MLIDIDKIIINDRIRKDYGNIEELANDIKENSLLNPVTLIPIGDGKYQLLAGERRLKSFNLLGYKQITANVISVKDAEQALRIEISENENRKEFSFSERVDWAKRLEEIEKVKAKERSQLNLIQNSDKETFPCREEGQTRDIVAKESGFGSGKQYDKAKYIYENGSEELIKQLDEGQLSINKAYNTLKEEKKQLEQEKQQLEQTNKILEKSYNELSQKYTNEKNNIKTIEVDNTDYSTIEKLNTKIKNIEKEKENIRVRLNLMEDKANAYKQDSLEYTKMKEDITYLIKQKDDLGRQLLAITDISELVVEINHLIKDKLAPVKYSKSLLEAKDDEIVLRNLTEMVEIVDQWSFEIKKYIPSKINYVEVL